MRGKSHHISGLFLLLSTLFWSGCTLSDPDPTLNDPALTLTYTQDYSVTHFTWDKVKVTGFKEYILLQSAMPIPDAPTPEVNQDVTVLKRINEVDQNFLTTSGFLIGTQTCYKLYCAVDDRFMYSPTVCFDQNNLSFDGFFDKGAHLEGNDEMAVYDRVNDEFAVVNYKTGQVTKRVTNSTFNFPSMEMQFYNNATNVVAYNQSAAWLGVYSFPSLNPIQVRSFGNVLWSARPFRNYIVAATNQPGAEFQVLQKSTLLAFDGRSGTTNSQNIAIFEGDPAVILTLGPAGSKRYTLSTTGFILSEQSIPARIGQPDQQFSCAQGTDIFIGGNKGDIISRDGENIVSLTSGNNNFVVLSRLNQDETKVVYILNRNGNMFLEIADISQLPQVTVERSFELPALTYADVIPEEDLIYVVGTTFSSSLPVTFTLKYPW